MVTTKPVLVRAFSISLAPINAFRQMKKVSGVFNELVEQRGYMSLRGPRVVYGLGCQKKRKLMSLNLTYDWKFCEI